MAAKIAELIPDNVTSWLSVDYDGRWLLVGKH